MKSFKQMLYNTESDITCAACNKNLHLIIVDIKSDVSRFTSHVSRLTSHASRLTPHASRLSSHASCLTSHVSRLTSHASRLTSHVSRLTSHASRLTPHVSRLTPHVCSQIQFEYHTLLLTFLPNGLHVHWIHLLSVCREGNQY